MIDNGLLKKGANFLNKSGEFCLYKKRWYDFHSVSKWTYSCRDKKTTQKYFVKDCSPREQTAEVLLSQIYAKHGFTTTIALPANDGKIITNDIAEKQKGERVYDFFVRKALRDRAMFSPDAVARIINDTCDVKDLKSASIPRWEELFTKEALTNRFRWDGFTIASGNSDDHLGNAVVYKNDKDVAYDIGHYDFGDAGDKCDCFLTKKYYAFYDDKLEVDRNTFLTSLAQDQQITKYINPQQLANEIGSVDVLGTAQDITQTIGFSLEQPVVDTIARSFNQTAEDLLSLCK